MNIRRGFVRLWVVVSMMWVIGVSCASYAEVAQAFQKPSKHLAQKEEKPKDAFTAAFGEQDDIDRMLAARAAHKDSDKEAKSGEINKKMIEDKDFDKFMSGDKKQEENEIFDAAFGKQKRAEEISDVITQKMVLALSFPVLTFAIWLLGAWVWAGFII